MRWSIFFLTGFVALLLDTSLLSVLRLDFGPLVNLTPSFIAVLVVYVALFAPRLAALWCALALGVVVDLLSAEPYTAAALIGPHALGSVAAAYVVLQLRPTVFRRRVLTVAVLTAGSAMLSHLIIIAVFTVRSWHPDWSLHWTETGITLELIRRFIIALYTGLLAVPAGWLLLVSTPFWGFQTQGQRPGLTGGFARQH